MRPCTESVSVRTGSDEAIGGKEPATERPSMAHGAVDVAPTGAAATLDLSGNAADTACKSSAEVEMARRKAMRFMAKSFCA